MVMSDTSWIRFGKDRYHQHLEMEQWCKENIGPGGWTQEAAVTREGFGNKIWLIHCMFGNTTFSFKEEKDFMWFKLRWA